MTFKALPLAGAVVALALLAAPARAWVFEDDGTSWPLFSFHQYGGDVNRPGATPDRPYWHGDDAVPLGLRWRDGEAAAAAAAAAQVTVAVQEPAVSPRRVRRIRRTLHAAPRHRAPPVCVPARAAPAHP